MSRDRPAWPAALALAALAAAPATATPPPLQASVRLALEREAAEGTRVSIEFPEAAAPAALAQCREAQPFLPAGARAWGRTVVGVRCVDGPPGTAFVPVVVRVHAQALVAARALAPGTVIAPGDVARAEVELTAAPGTVLGDEREAVGRTVARAVPAGAAIRDESLRVAYAVGAGDHVRVVYAGAGFSVTADARALAAAREGQGVRVQTESGRVLTGVARAGRVVEIRAAP